MYFNVVLGRYVFADLNPCMVGYEDCTPLTSWGPRKRNVSIIHYVFSGKGILEKNGKTYEVDAGKAFIIHAGETAKYTADETDPWSYAWIGFDGKLVENFRSLPDVFEYEGHFFEEMSNLIFEKRNKLSDFYVAGRLICLYDELGLSEKVWREERIERVVDRAIRDVNLVNKFSVSSVAESVGVTREYLTARYKSKTGNSIRDAKVQYRIEKAKRLLEAGFSVGEVAEAVGYSERSAFSHIFKKKTGVTPGEWKKNAKA